MSEEELLEILKDYLKTMTLYEDFYHFKIEKLGYDRDELPSPFNEE